MILSGIGMLGAVLAGHRIWWSWYVYLAAIGWWLTYALITDDYKYLPLIIVYTVIYSTNAYYWTRNHRRHGEVRVPLKGDRRYTRAGNRRKARQEGNGGVS